MTERVRFIAAWSRGDATVTALSARDAKKPYPEGKGKGRGLPIYRSMI